MSDFPTKINDTAYEGRVYSIGDLRVTPGGDPVCNARMSINRKFDGEWHSKWFDLTAWGDAADVLASCQHKDEVIVRGRLDLSKPYTKKDGTIVEADFAITADSVERAGGSTEPAPVSASQPAINPDDVPF